MQVYVQAKSKKSINERLAAGQQVTAVEHKLGDETCHRLTELPKGTVIKVWEKLAGGSPYAKSYGTWNGKKVV